MTPTSDIVREIQESISSDRVWAVQRLAELAEAYAQACNDVSERTYRIRFLLQEGQTEEANRLAAEEPKLQGEFHSLEFDGKNDWLDLCEAGGLAVPTSYDLEMIRDIIEELARAAAGGVDTREIPRVAQPIVTVGEEWQQPLPGGAPTDQYPKRVRELIRTYRRMSLGLAPLAHRLTILRRLREEDHRHDLWEADVRLFEAARIDELARLATRAGRQGNLKALEAILSNLQSNEWTEKPTAHIRSVEKLILPHREKFAAERYAEILTEMREAHARMDEEASRELMSQWQTVKQDTGIEADPADLEQIEPVQSWLKELEEIRAEENEFLDACARLAAAVNTAKDLKTFENRVADVLRRGRGMPADLKDAVELKRAELKQAAKRKRTLWTVTIIAAAALIALGAGIGISQHAKKTKLQRCWRPIAKALDERNLDRAQKLLDYVKLNHIEIYRTPEIQELQHRCIELQKKETARKEQFELVIKELNVAGGEPRSIPRLENLLALAEKHARPDRLEEKQRVQDWRKRIDQLKSEQEEQLAKENEELLQQVENCYQAVRDAYRAEQEDFQSLAQQCLRLAEAMLDKPRGLSDDQEDREDRLDTIIESIKTMKADDVERKREHKVIRRALDKIWELGTRPQDLAEELRLFARKHPRHALAEDFARVAKMAPQYKSLQAWERIRRAWRSMRVDNGRDAEGRLKQVEGYLDDHPSSAFHDGIAAYRSYLGVARDALPEGEFKHRSSLEEYLSDRLLAGVFVIETTYGSYYSFKDKMTPISVGGVTRGWAFEAIVDLENTTKIVNITTKELVSKPKPAPQTHFAKSALKELGEFKGKGWETFYLKLAELARNSTDIDPILRVMLLKNILEYAVDTTPFNIKEIETIKEKLNEMYELIDWMNPRDKEANDKRLRYSTFLTGRSFAPLIKSIEERMAKLESSLAAYKPVGILLSLLEIRLVNGLKDGPLYVVSGAGENRTVLRQIGKILKGEQLLDNATRPFGSPVFVKVE